MRPLFRACAIAFPLLLTPVLPAVAQIADAEAASPLRLIEDVRIGSAVDPNYGFSRIGATVDVDRDGQLYVYEAQDYQIRVYSPDGHLLRRIGRRGQGPGEFTGVTRYGVKGDTVWVVESQANRITLFKRDGTLITTATAPEITVPLYMQWGVVRPYVMRADGKFTSNMSEFRGAAFYRNSSLPPASNLAQADTGRYPRVLFSATGAVLDTTGWDMRIPAPAGPPPQVVQRDGGVIRTVPRPMSDVRMLVVHADGRFLVDRVTPKTAAPSMFHVSRINMEGDTLYSRAYRYSPVRYSPAVLDSLAAGFSGAVAMGSAAPAKPSPEVISEIRSKMDFPPFQPPIQASFAGNDGSLWLRREDDASNMYRWLLINPQGQLVGRVEIPKNLRIAWSSGETLWAVVTDDDDVQWLVKYHLGPQAL